MARPGLDERFRRSQLHRYLLSDEEVLVAQRQHWAALWQPIIVGAGGIVLVIAVNTYLPPSVLTDLLWWGLLGVAIWAALQWVEWWHSWMIATDKRVMVNYGLLNQGVALFSLSRVPDLTYTRSPLGRLLGYGQLEREGTSGDLSLHKLSFVEHPRETYTTICAAIFELQDRMFGMDDDDHDHDHDHDHRLNNGPVPHTPGLNDPYVTRASRKESGGSWEGPTQDEDPPGIRVHYGVSRRQTPDPWHLSPDLRDSALGEADTGPIAYRRSATDEVDDWLPTTNDKDHHDGPDQHHHIDKDHDRDHPGA